MKKTIYLLLTLTFVMSFMTIACTSQDVELPNNDAPMQNGVISMDEAQSRLVDILDNPVIRQSLPNTQERGLLSNKFFVTNGRALDREGKMLTRADMGEACVYIFDIDTAGGYAIMGAQPELPELIAICNGNPNSNDETPDTLSSCLSMIRDSLKVTTDPIIIDNPGEEVYRVRGKTTYRKLSLYQTIDHAWGCNPPFSIAWYCAGIKPEEYCDPTWCGNIALTQLMVHPNYRLDGDNINYDDYRTIAQINLLKEDWWSFWDLSMRIKGVSSFFPGFIYRNVCWYNKLTIGDELAQGFSNLNYREVGSHKSFNVEHVADEIAGGHPVLMLSNGAHIWLSSQIIAQDRPIYCVGKETGKIYETFTSTTYLLHCNWGLEGAYNGFYDTHFFTKTESDLEIHEGMPDYIITTPNPTLNDFFNNVTVYSGMRK